uniref:Out at first protein n=1 Tax=Graphocephala atropunctata TaxID=36148 RepID=A0A1B6L0A5_9HEMI
MGIGVSVAIEGYWLVFVIVFFSINFGDTQLLINVKNQGGDVLQETISANISDDAVMLEFQRSDGTLVTQLVDFKHEVQILKALILGEEERGQSQYQVMCFVCHIDKNEFISADAMSKLRQKNPGTIRIPEEDRGRENFTMDLFVDVARAAVISKHVPALCAEAGDATYTRRVDIDLWSQMPGASRTSLLSAVREYNGLVPPPGRCQETHSPWQPCTCHLELCIGWYPCSLKYCRGSARGANYRCGIRTCRKCNLFLYYVRQKQLCLWDE